MNNFETLMEKLDEIMENQKKIISQVTEDSGDKRPVKEVSGIGIVFEDGSHGSAEVARIVKESRDQGIERGKVEAITGRSGKPAQRIMRAIAQEFDHMIFKKGDNTGPSKLFHEDYLPG